MLRADESHGVWWEKEREKGLTVTVSGGGAVAPCYAVAEGEDKEWGTVLDTWVVQGEGCGERSLRRRRERCYDLVGSLDIGGEREMTYWQLRGRVK